MENMANHKSETLVLLYSPQYVVDTPPFFSLPFSSAEINKRFVIIDKAYLFAMHWTTFRQSIRLLRDVLFAQLHVPSLLYYPLLLAMTATMSPSLLQPFSLLTHVDFTLARHQLWASAQDFQELNIKMSVMTKSKSDLKKGALQTVLGLLQADTSAYMCTFMNF